MSRANVGEAYYRLKHRSYGSDTDSDHLKEEFIRLRNSTRNTLQQSWIERESLHQQCGVCDEVIAIHNEELTEIRDRKEAWKERCLIAEATLQEPSEEKDSLRQYRRLSLPERLRLWAGGNNEQNIETKEIIRPRDSLQDRKRPAFIRSASLPVRLWVGGNDDQDKETKLQDISEQRDSLQDHKRPAFTRSISSVRVGRKKYKDNVHISEFDWKLSSRDAAISSLEKTLNDNLKLTNNMEAEMQSLVETQRIKEKQMYDSHAQKEKKFKEVIESLSKELCKEVAQSSSMSETWD
mmetsp:Transcript_24539/g.28947  ORF Transcript_24539/g.28947 Transcript_24539/m.28947 type:complete len:294 (-) Transcript_24539:119-1000(-)|eukprot:CAMPEP_0198272652 /NCGR_PEP_ID=MMETSP1447-20131203/54004_1 /TAXON_ID=420782 /ORGANISM="Chaetoceros dichaeta, Strain CCMP1751" /LENGTH=293 /DNA_ID=CAMNT_0043965967 /DNA_START=176 /DNA_END=1057 /DNA_ORIENTATION=+